MKIAIVTMWYNEEDLAPFFLKHYNYVNKIFVYLATDTYDNTRGICGACSNVKIVDDPAYLGGFDDIVKIRRTNHAVRGLRGKFDWVYVVDADEFIQQPKQYRSAREFLRRQVKKGYNLVYARMYQVYRHVTDVDLDISKPVLPQRCHGNPNLRSLHNRRYVKPIVAKPETGISWGAGCHSYHGNKHVIRRAREHYIGAHWCMADDSFPVKRRIRDRKLRLSKQNIAARRGRQHIDATEESVLRELKAHRRDPDVLSSLLP